MWRPLYDAVFTVLIILLRLSESVSPGKHLFFYSPDQMCSHTVGNFHILQRLQESVCEARVLFSPPMQPMWRPLYDVGFTLLILLLRFSEGVSPGKHLCSYSPDQMYSNTVRELSYPPKTLGKSVKPVYCFPHQCICKDYLESGLFGVIF